MSIGVTNCCSSREIPVEATSSVAPPTGGPEPQPWIQEPRPLLRGTTCCSSREAPGEATGIPPTSGRDSALVSEVEGPGYKFSVPTAGRVTHPREERSPYPSECETTGGDWSVKSRQHEPRVIPFREGFLFRLAW